MTDKKMYSENEVVEIAKAYSELATTIGNIKGLGLEIHDPSLNTSEILSKIKERVYRIIPEKIRRGTPEIFNELERKIDYLKGNITEKKILCKELEKIISFNSIENHLNSQSK